MTVAEAHIALAQMIGDPILVVGSSIPDGVRYSKALRDIYLWRGMVHVIQMRFNALNGLPHEQVADQLALQFPTSIIEEEDVVTNIPQEGEYSLTRQAVFILGVGTHGRPGTDREVMYSWKSAHDFRAISRRKSVIAPDPCYTTLDTPTGPKIRYYMNSQDFAAIGGASNGIASLFVEFLPIPIRPAVQAYDDLMDFELTYMDEALAWADMAARYDAQDLTANPLIAMGGNR